MWFLILLREYTFGKLQPINRRHIIFQTSSCARQHALYKAQNEHVIRNRHGRADMVMEKLQSMETEHVNEYMMAVHMNKPLPKDATMWFRKCVEAEMELYSS